MILHTLRRLAPGRPHTAGARVRTDVRRLDAAQRERLQRNLRAMLRPETV